MFRLYYQRKLEVQVKQREDFARALLSDSMNPLAKFGGNGVGGSVFSGGGGSGGGGGGGGVGASPLKMPSKK
jgi:uncharacterized membrane protein YgcG